MISCSKSYFLGWLLLLTFPLQLSAAEMRERTIPAGWNLSATLALFRNLAMLDASTIPETKGEVYFARDEKYSEGGDGQVFTNTYHFFRTTTDDKFLQVTVVEEHRLADVEIGADVADEAVPFHRVADLSQSFTVIDALPDSAKIQKQISKLLCYIFDHHQVLSASEAGEMARKLNYKSEGRFRPSDYKQPRVSYLEGDGKHVEKVRIYGLDTLLSQRKSLIDEGDALDNQVLEISVNESGTAQVSLGTLNR